MTEKEFFKNLFLLVDFFLLSCYNTPCSGCSAVGSAPGLGPGCRRFKSCHSDQKRKQTLAVCFLFSLEMIGNAEMRHRFEVRSHRKHGTPQSFAGSNPVIPTKKENRPLRSVSFFAGNDGQCEMRRRFSIKQPSVACKREHFMV